MKHLLPRNRFRTWVYAVAGLLFAVVLLSGVLSGIRIVLYMAG